MDGIANHFPARSALYCSILHTISIFSEVVLLPPPVQNLFRLGSSAFPLFFFYETTTAIVYCVIVYNVLVNSRPSLLCTVSEANGSLPALPTAAPSKSTFKFGCQKLVGISSFSLSPHFAAFFDNKLCSEFLIQIIHPPLSDLHLAKPV